MIPRRSGALALAGALAFAGAHALGGCALDPLSTPPEEARPTAADQGAALFESPSLSTAPFNTYACSTCHLAEPSSASDVVRTGAPLAGVLDRPTYWGGSEIDLLRAVNHCLMYFMLQDEPWTGQEPEAVALYAYLESLSESAAATAEPAPFTIVKLPLDLPDGDRMRGLEVYDRSCATCHGALHTGEARLVDQAPVLPDDVLASHPTSDYSAEERRLVFVSKIRHGSFLGHTGQMPPFSAEVLSESDVRDLLAVFFAP